MDTKTVTTKAGTTVQVPADATYFPKERVQQYLASNENQIMAAVQVENNQRLSRFKGPVANWTAAAENARAHGQPLPPKPVAENARVYHQVDDDQGGAYVWDDDSGDPVATCPDLAAPTAVYVIPQADYHMLNVIPVPAGDTIPVGQTISDPDGAQWTKVQSATPWGVATYYRRVQPV